MQIEVYRFLTGNEYTDNEKLFFWFMTRMIEQGGYDQKYTLAKYDLISILRGSNKGAFFTQSVSDRVKQWFRIGFVTEARLTIELTAEAKSWFIMYAKEMKCGQELTEITSNKTIARYLYLLGVLSASDTMFYDDDYWGIGCFTDLEYHRKTRKLNRWEIQALLDDALEK